MAENSAVRSSLVVPSGDRGQSVRDALSWIRCPHEPALFWGLALLHLVPVWAFAYLPTQDGPSHLANALILRDYGKPGAGYDAVFELRDEPLPNLTSHLLLAGLLHVVSPLVAEKILVSLYILGFAAGVRYFLGGQGLRCTPLSWLALLLVYNRCLWMGFFNYCLSLALLWFFLGFCLRRARTLDWPTAAALMVLFTALFFTHLAGFLLAVVGGVLAAVVTAPRRILSPALIVLACLPAACLTMAYFERTGFFRAASAMQVVQQPLARLQGRQTISLTTDLASLDDELAGWHAGAVPLSLVLLGVAALTALAAGPAPPTSGAVFGGVFGLLVLAVYLLAPDDLGMTHGGFLHARLAPLPFIAALACLREPARRPVRLALRGLTAALLVGNLVLVALTVQAGNREIDRYTAGQAAVRPRERLFVVQQNPRLTPLVNPLLHAADYYSVQASCVNLDNYEADTPHFPVAYRPGVQRGRDSWIGYSQRDRVDVVLSWQPGSRQARRGPAGWPEVFRQGPLSIYRRPPPPERGEDASAKGR